MSDPVSPVVWFEVLGQDADMLQDFYGELLGWTFERRSLLSYAVVAPPGKVGIAGCVGQAPIQELPDVRVAVVTDPEGRVVGLCADPLRG